MPPRNSILLLICIFFSSSAYSDPQSKSWSNWLIDDTGVQASFTLAQRDATTLTTLADSANLSRRMQIELAQSVAITPAQDSCMGPEVFAERAKPGFLRYQLRWSCPPQMKRIQIRISNLMQEIPSHLHFARFTLIEANKHRELEQLFSRRSLQHDIELGETGGTSSTSIDAEQVWLTYTAFGFEHILIGIDHIAFLLGLMLLTRRLRDIIFVVTGFTLGHSVTLALTTLGWVTPAQTVVEGLIGYTIALVALENVLSGAADHRRAALICGTLLTALAALSLAFQIGPPYLALLGIALFSWCYLQLSSSPIESQKLRPALTVLFGLIHGFGFASVLMEVGLPSSSLLPALFAFNLGVELGQIAIVVAMTALGLLGRHLFRQRLIIETSLNASLCGLGVFWFVQRLY